MRAAPLLFLAACYTPPDLDTVRDAPVLSSDEDSPFFVCAAEREARVACVIDGDTVDLNGCGDEAEARVRLLGIDAPETEKPAAPAECYANEAWDELARLVESRVVTVSFDRECTDVFQRTLAYLWIDGDEARRLLDDRVVDDVLRLFGTEDDPEALFPVNAYLLVRGYAERFDEDWVEPLRWEPELIAAERLAQARNDGLWGVCE